MSPPTDEELEMIAMAADDEEPAPHDYYDNPACQFCGSEMETGMTDDGQYYYFCSCVCNMIFVEELK